MLLTILLLLVAIICPQNPPPQQRPVVVQQQAVQEIRCNSQDLNSELILPQKNSCKHDFKTYRYLETMEEHLTMVDSASEYFASAVQENNIHLYNNSLFVHGLLPKAQIRNPSAEMIPHQGGSIASSLSCSCQ